MSPSRSGSALLLTLLLSALATKVALPAQDDGFTQAMERYRAMRERPSLNRRIEGRRLLVQTGDPRVLEVLRADYDDPGEPEEMVRSVILTELADFWRGEPITSVWRQWRSTRAEKGDAWLWYRALCVEGVGAAGSWREIFAERLPTELRAVVLSAAAFAPDGPTLDEATLALISSTIERLPTRSYERALILEGLAGLFEKRGKELDARQRAVLRGLASEMGDRNTSQRTRIVLARTLGRDDIGPDAAGWLELLADVPTEELELAYAKRRAKSIPGFFGIPQHGGSIAYVIDASDSMLEPLTPRELDEMQPLTGAGRKSGARDAGPKRVDAAERAVDWSKVKNRFDAATELLKLALRRLSREQRFTVVIFGDQAEYLPATHGLVEASEDNVRKVCEQIDAIEPQPDRAINRHRPHGVLRGDTNLHGGMLLAFRAGQVKKTRAVKPSDDKPAHRSSNGPPKEAKAQPEPAWVPLDERGVDTIYLLSDGAPSADNWNGTDTNDGSIVQDPETKQQSERTGTVVYPGPFAWPPYLVPDLRRLNLLQRSAIHCIGLGEADFTLLEKIAAVGHGQVIKIGR
ncbi:MAG: hypothetical protein HZB39_02415 [Planctomycetes bacterium]|nr:hypothetical protein [Planctomycetota bacterium]